MAALNGAALPPNDRTERLRRCRRTAEALPPNDRSASCQHHKAFLPSFGLVVTQG
jgi:hypothetical protein